MFGTRERENRKESDRKRFEKESSRSCGVWNERTRERKERDAKRFEKKSKRSVVVCC